MKARSAAVVEANVVRQEFLAFAGLLFATFGWASAFVAGKMVLAELTPLVAATCRYALATLMLLPFALRTRSHAAIRPALAPLGVMVVCGGVLYPWLFLAALSRTSATNTSLLIALNPVFTVLLVPLIGERLGQQRLAGVLLALVGATTVITRGNIRHVTEITLNTGDLLAVAAAACWAAFNLASRRTVTQLSPALTNAVIYGGGGVILGMLARGDHPWQQLASASAAAVTGVALMALLSSVLAGQLFLLGVRTLGVGRTVVFVYFVPLVTAVLSALVLGESFESPQAIGGVAVLAGVYFSSQK